MKRCRPIIAAAVVLGVLLIGAFAIIYKMREPVLDGKPPARYTITFVEPLQVEEAKELLQKYDVSLLHITYSAPGFSGSGLATSVDYIEEVEQNIISSWKRDASDGSLTKEERKKAGRFLDWSKNNRLKVSEFEGIGSPEEALKADSRVKTVDEY